MLLGIYVSCSNRARRLCLIEHRFTPRPLSQRMHRFTRFTTRQSPSAPFASCNGLSFGAASPLAYAKTRRHWSPSATFATAATIAACVRLLSRRPHLTCRSSGRPSAAAYLYVRPHEVASRLAHGRSHFSHHWRKAQWQRYVKATSQS